MSIEVSVRRKREWKRKKGGREMD